MQGVLCFYDHELGLVKLRVKDASVVYDQGYALLALYDAGFYPVEGFPVLAVFGYN